MNFKRISLVAFASVSSLFSQGQPNYLPIKAPFAQTLVVNTKAKHPELQKLGLHAIAPGQTEYAIIANIFPEKVGKKSSKGDIDVITNGKPLCKKNEKEQFYDLKLPIADATGKQFGLNVMEINFKFAKDSEDALAQATRVRDEIQGQIPSFNALFGTATALESVRVDTLAVGKTKFDHFGVDTVHNRLFATAEDQHQALVLDLTSGKQIARLEGIAKPHTILYRSDLDRIYVTDGIDGALKVFDGHSYKLTQSVPLAKDADAIGFEPARNLLYVANGGKDAGQSNSMLSIIDTTNGAKVNEIRIGSKTLEGIALDIWRPRGYVNDKAENEVVVLDRWNNKAVDSWPVTLGQENVAMALDEQHQRLFVGCRSGRIVVFDSNSGKEQQALTIPPGIDDLQFDLASKRLYAVGGGTVSVFEKSDADHYNPLTPVSGLGKAATGTLVSEINRFYVAIPTSETDQAAVRVLQPVNCLPIKAVPAPVKEPVQAPKALELDFATMAAHPELRKMGFHAVLPGGHESVIIANVNTTRIGIASSDGDLASVKDGKTACSKRDDGAFFGVKQPLKDATGKIIGILVMEIPYTAALNEEEAMKKGNSIGEQVAHQIPSYNALFEETTSGSQRKADSGLGQS